MDLLEFYKLELSIILPKIQALVQKAASKPQKLAHIKDSLYLSIEKIKLSVLHKYGRSMSLQEFQVQYDRSTCPLKLEIALAIQNALEGKNYSLEVQDDTGLTQELYFQVMTKMYAVIRHLIYRELKSKTSEQEINDFLEKMDLNPIRVQVFQLYEIKSRNPVLTLFKYALHNSNPGFTQYLDCLKQAHENFLQVMIEGKQFQKMEQNPLHSSDLSYGVPQLFNEMLDERLDGQSQGFEQLIKELMETKLMADSGSYRNTSEVGRETVRYTEAIHK